MSLPNAVIAEGHVLIQETLRLQLKAVVDVIAAVEDGAATLEAVCTKSSSGASADPR